MALRAWFQDDLAAKTEIAERMRQFGCHLEEIVGGKDYAGRGVARMSCRVGVVAIEDFEVHVVGVEIEVPAAVEVHFIAGVSVVLEIHARSEDAGIEIVGSGPMQAALSGSMAVALARTVEAIVAGPIDIAIKMTPVASLRSSTAKSGRERNDRKKKSHA